MWAFLISFLAVVHVFPRPVRSVNPAFATWLQQYKRHYVDFRELNFRELVFSTNVNTITAQNALYPQSKKYLLAVNEFADLTQDEFISRFAKGSTGRFYPARRLREAEAPTHEERELQSSVDWVASGAVTTPKHSGRCGASYAFAAVGAVEGISKIASGTLPTVSVQELIDCPGQEYGSGGCSGGYVDGSFMYIKNKNGIVSETIYPYVGVQSPCGRTSTQGVAATITNFQYLTQNSDTALAQRVAIQPVAVLVNAASTVWQFYSSGIINDASSCSGSVTDAALVVGYGSQGSFPQTINYFKLKYNLGTAWGESGYIRIKRTPTANGGAGICGIYTMPMIPVKS